MERQTNIIATLGPASHNEEVLRKMIPYIDMVRLNFSWGTHEDMEFLINLVRRVSKESSKKISIIQDLSGPRTQGEHGHYFKDGARGIIMEKDKHDLLFGVAQGVDYIAMSYVGSGRDVFELKELIKESGAQIPVIAKIERKEAINVIDEIIAASDAIMIARGDLGQAFPIEEVPFLERTILNLCAKENKFVIVATEMLLSMVTKDRPTRAEVTDVAYAVTGYASAVMLSEETAQGDHPDKVVEVLDRIVRYAEAHRAVY
jgi:pyruvate kinase